MKVERTAKKTTLTITIDAYDHKDMVNVDGIPMNNGEDQAEAWLNATMVAAQTINEFYRQVRANRKQNTLRASDSTLLCPQAGPTLPAKRRRKLDSDQTQDL